MWRFPLPTLGTHAKSKGTDKGKGKGAKGGGGGGGGGKRSRTGKGRHKSDRPDPLTQRFQKHNVVCVEKRDTGKPTVRTLMIYMPPAKRGVRFFTLLVHKPGVWRLRPLVQCLKTLTAVQSFLKVVDNGACGRKLDLSWVSVFLLGGHAIVDCGAAVHCIGEMAAARISQRNAASGDDRILVFEDKAQQFEFRDGGNSIEASFAATLPVRIGEKPTW